MQFEYTSEAILNILAAVKDTLKGEEALARINPPCVVVGDIHGQVSSCLHEDEASSGTCSASSASSPRRRRRAP